MKAVLEYPATSAPAAEVIEHTPQHRVSNLMRVCPNFPPVLISPVETLTLVAKNTRREESSFLAAIQRRLA